MLGSALSFKAKMKVYLSICSQARSAGPSQGSMTQTLNASNSTLAATWQYQAAKRNSTNRSTREAFDPWVFYRPARHRQLLWIGHQTADPTAAGLSERGNGGENEKQGETLARTPHFTSATGFPYRRSDCR